MKALALVVTVAVALVASGCVTKQKPIGDAKASGETAPKRASLWPRATASVPVKLPERSSDA